MSYNLAFKTSNSAGEICATTAGTGAGTGTGTGVGVDNNGLDTWTFGIYYYINGLYEDVKFG